VVGPVLDICVAGPELSQRRCVEPEACPQSIAILGQAPRGHGGQLLVLFAFVTLTDVIRCLRDLKKQ
jgi:hypothetical protein